MNAMDRLFEDARRDGLWFYSPYQGLWLSPDELAEHQQKGLLMLAASHWRLRDPRERLRELREQAERAAKAVDDFETQLNEARAVDQS